MPGLALGIDLGTTNSCACVFNNGELQTIKNELGENVTPSCVWISDDDDVTVGRAAISTWEGDPAGVIYDVKRLIGRRLSDPVLAGDVHFWSFDVIDQENKPKIHVHGKSYHPEQISAEVLKSLKASADIFLRSDATPKAVITVPAYFNNGQREATKHAGIIAGIDVLRIINEPTAAAISYCFHQPPDVLAGIGNLLVFDLGGGTFDVSVIRLEPQGRLRVLAVGGDTHLGGSDFDRGIIELCLKEFCALNTINRDNYEISKPKAWRKLQRRLKNECQRAKEYLSAAKKVRISLDAALEGRDLQINLSRAKFNEINQHYFDRCIDIMKNVLPDAGKTPGEIDEVLLVGGSTRIPKIREMIQDLFGRPPCVTLNASEAVAEGAAILAALIVPGQSPDGIKAKDGCRFRMDLEDVIPLSISISAFIPYTSTLKSYKIIPRNTRIPHESSPMRFETRMDHQTIKICVYEGEDEDPQGNYKLGDFVARGLPDGLKGEPYWVAMRLSEEGLLEVVASYSNQLTDRLCMEINTGRLSREQAFALADDKVLSRISTTARKETGQCAVNPGF